MFRPDWWVDPWSTIGYLASGRYSPDFVGVISVMFLRPLLWMMVTRNLYNKTKQVVKQKCNVM